MNFFRFFLLLFTLILLPVTLAQAQTSPSIADLEKQKAAAVAAENYPLAGELSKKIKEQKAKEEADKLRQVAEQQRKIEKAQQLEALTKEKKAAVASEDYLKAAEIQNKIKKITEIDDLEKEKKDAIAEQDYEKAGEIFKRIKYLKEQEEQDIVASQKKALVDKQVAELDKQKKEAVANQNYVLAGEINKKIIALKEDKPAQVTKPQYAATSNPSQNTSNTNQNTNKLNSLAVSGNNPSTNYSSKPSSGSVVYTKSEKSKIRQSEDNTTAGIKYRRSSLYTMMIDEPSRKYSDVIAQSFVESPLPVKFNDHDLNEKTIPGGSHDELTNIDNYLNANAVAKTLIAKWFGRSEKGTFNMDLVAQRGNYNASAADLKLAALQSRGSAILADAGEDLISNTFVVINDFGYTNKEEVAKKAKVGLGILNMASSLAGGPDLSTVTTVASAGLTIAGKGYIIKNTSYLYRLVWNEEVAAYFYKELWMDDSSFDPAKKQAFDNSNFFTLKYIGQESAIADLQSNVFTNKTEEQLIARATVKAVDAGIAKLQRKFEEFRTKTPLSTVEPLTAKIGTKEGVEPGDRFEVLEGVQDASGKITYVQKGIITATKDIWDNQFDVGDPNAPQGNQFTTFKGSGNFYPGMLIKQIR